VEVFDQFGSIASGLVYFALGFRLILLGARTRSATEFLLGSTFLCWSLYYVLRIISIELQSQPALESQVLITSRIIDNLGSVIFAFFPLLAFRRGSNWAKWLANTIAICLIAGTAGSIWVGDPEGVNPLTNGWWWPEWLGSIAAGIWIGVEGFHHYGMTRSRVRLGLCEPIVSHRYLLLGLVGMAWTLLDFVVVGQYVDYWANQTWSAALDNLVGLFEIAALAMIWLAYFAPAAYQRRIAGTSPAAEPDEA
jgi:hypothetical protein